MHADAVVKSKPGPDGGQVHLLLCVHASVTRQAIGSQEPGTAGRKHSRGAPRDLFSPERRQVSACHSRNTNTNTCVPVPAAGGPWKLTNGGPAATGWRRIHQTRIDRSVPGFLRPVYSVRTHTTARPRHCAATVHAAIAGPKRTQEPSPAGVVRFEGPR
jgi:hypothetical protein